MLVERTSNYAWLRNRDVSEKRKEHLKKRIKEEFVESRGTYGPDRIIAELRKKGEQLGRVRCRDLMQEMGLTHAITGTKPRV